MAASGMALTPGRPARAVYAPRRFASAGPPPAWQRLRFLARLLITLCVLAAGAMAMPASATPVPVPTYSAPVLDTTGTLDSAQTAALTEKILSIEAQTQATVVVLMLPTTGEDAIEQYAMRVFEAWQPGDARRDDGILIVVAKNDRRMRIEVGQGLEGSVPDVLAGRIIDQQMKPRFRDNDYAGGLESALDSLGAAVRGEEQATETPPDIADTTPLDGARSAGRGGITLFGWVFFATVVWGFAIGMVRARYPWKWPVTVGVAAAVPVAGAAVLRNPGMAAVLLSFPAPLAFALGLGCARSRKVRIGVGIVALVVAALAGTGYVVGADRFGWGLLYVVGGGIGCLLIGIIVVGMRMAYQRSMVEFCVRITVVAGIVTFVAMSNPPDITGVDWSSWIPTALAAGLSMLFVFAPSGGSGGSDSDDSSGGGSSSSSSGSGGSSGSSSSSGGSSGGSSSGGGASGSW